MVHSLNSTLSQEIRSSMYGNIAWTEEVLVLIEAFYIHQLQDVEVVEDTSHFRASF
jgi:hypothetical protein